LKVMKYDNEMQDMEEGKNTPPSHEKPQQIEMGDGEIENSTANNPFKRKVEPGDIIVAVNDIRGDMSMMIVELTKPNVKLTLQRDEFNSFDDLRPAHIGWVGEGDESDCEVDIVDGRVIELTVMDEDGNRKPATSTSDIVLTKTVGVPLDIAEGHVPSSMKHKKEARVALLALEDEEPSSLYRWLVCSLGFGWITLLPVLLTRNAPGKQRGNIPRDFFLKPAAILIPVLFSLWLIDTAQLLPIDVWIWDGWYDLMPLVHPFYYFLVAHVVIPTIFATLLFQAAVYDEKYVLDQREDLQEECEIKVIAEDPNPTILKELLCGNPFFISWVGTCQGLQIVIFSLIFRRQFQTDRAKRLCTKISGVYLFTCLFQFLMLTTLYKLEFSSYPSFYVTVFLFVIQIPTLIFLFVLMLVSAGFGKMDERNTNDQRKERLKEADPKCSTVLPVSVLDDGDYGVCYLC